MEIIIQLQARAPGYQAKEHHSPHCTRRVNVRDRVQTARSIWNDILSKISTSDFICFTKTFLLFPLVFIYIFLPGWIIESYSFFFFFKCPILKTLPGERKFVLLSEVALVSFSYLCASYFFGLGALNMLHLGLQFSHCGSLILSLHLCLQLHHRSRKTK